MVERRHGSRAAMIQGRRGRWRNPELGQKPVSRGQAHTQDKEAVVWDL